jgi:hypothetical protein
VREACCERMNAPPRFWIAEKELGTKSGWHALTRKDRRTKTDLENGNRAADDKIQGNQKLDAIRRPTAAVLRPKENTNEKSSEDQCD